MYEAFLSQAPWKWLFYDILKDNIFLFFPYLQCIVQVLVQSKGLGEKKKVLSPTGSTAPEMFLQLSSSVTLWHHTSSPCHTFLPMFIVEVKLTTQLKTWQNREMTVSCAASGVCVSCFFFFQLIQLIVNGVFSSVVPKVGGVPPRGGAGVITGEVQLG